MKFAFYVCLCVGGDVEIYAHVTGKFSNVFYYSHVDSSSSSNCKHLFFINIKCVHENLKNINFRIIKCIQITRFSALFIQQFFFISKQLFSQPHELFAEDIQGKCHKKYFYVREDIILQFPLPSPFSLHLFYRIFLYDYNNKFSTYWQFVLVEAHPKFSIF